jgi:hypothetical protein
VWGVASSARLYRAGDGLLRRDVTLAVAADADDAMMRHPALQGRTHSRAAGLLVCSGFVWVPSQHG